MTHCWIGVASRDHVKTAVEGDFCQFNHGKEAPLKRLREGDRLFYYSPREHMGAGDAIQAFTAVGVLTAGDPYRLETDAAFRPFRREVRYFASHDAGIRSLLTQLSFTRERSSWGMVMRRGLFEISQEDARTIEDAMGVADRIA